MVEGCCNDPQGTKTCLRVEYRAAADWASIVWQDLTGAKKLKFDWPQSVKPPEMRPFPVVLVCFFLFGLKVPAEGGRSPTGTGTLHASILGKLCRH